MRHLTNCAVATATTLVLLSTGCGKGDGNASPRVSNVPLQLTAGGGDVFTLDLSSFVRDPEGGALSYAVVSGGGSFAGSVFSHQFESLGTYTVQFSVTDPAGGSSLGDFDVKVRTANLAVIPAGDDLSLLDTDTEQFIPVTVSAGFVDTFRATLSRGHVIYERTNGSQRLFVFDTNTRATSALGNSATEDTRYAAQTPDHRVIYTRAATATPTDTDLHIWDSRFGVSQEISAAVGVPDGNPMVTSGGLVYYESGAPANVYRFDPVLSASTAVTASATDNTLRAVLADDSVVYSRVGGGGELDLFHYTVAGGEVEIGLDLGATVLDQTRSYRASTSSNQVVFEVTGATDLDVYVFDPVSGVSTAVATTASADDVVVGVTALDEVVIETAVSPTNRDVYLFTDGASPLRAVAATADNEVFEASLSSGDLVVRVESAGGDTLSLYDTSGSAASALAPAGSSFDQVLENDNVVYTTAADVFVVNTTGAPAPIGVGGAGAVFAGEAGGGDFVVQTTAAAQLDLVLWDESAGAAVTVSSVVGDDAFGVALDDGDLLFLREDPVKATTDLFLWSSTTLAEKQLTDTTIDHAVSATFSATSI